MVVISFEICFTMHENKRNPTQPVRQDRKETLRGAVSVLGFDSRLFSAGDSIRAAAEKSHRVCVQCCEALCALSPGVDAVCQPRHRLLCSHLLPAVTPERPSEISLYI